MLLSTVWLISPKASEISLVPTEPYKIPSSVTGTLISTFTPSIESARPWAFAISSADAAASSDFLLSTYFRFSSEANIAFFLGIKKFLANQSLTDFNSIDSSDKINNIIDTDNSDNSSSSSSSDNLDNSKKFYNKINEETIIKPKQDNFYNEWLKNHPNDAIRYNGQYLTDLHKDLPWKIDNYADLDAIKKEYSNNSYITNIINEHSKEFEMNVLKEAQARAFDEYMETKATPEEYAKYQNFLKNLGYNSYEDYVKDMNDKDPFFKALRKSNYLTYERWSNLK